MGAENIQNKCNKQGIYVFKIRYPYDHKYVLQQLHLDWHFSIPVDKQPIADTTIKITETSLIQRVVKTNTREIGETEFI